MTSASNRLYRGELNGNPSVALQAIVDEFNFEADQTERSVFGVAPDESDHKFATDLRDVAKKVQVTKAHVDVAIGKALESVYAQLAQEIREQKMAGDMSNEIADALLTGCWEGCAL